MKEQKEKIEWDKKKIVVFVIFLAVLLIGLYKVKTIILDKNVSKEKSSSLVSKQDVKGAQTIESPAQSLKNNVQEQINSLKSEAQNINVVDIATSSPQVQKIINDLKAIQNYPSNQLKQTCINICNRL
ncbi:MAG TPA: hypothetical protein VES68_04085 [Candidatus Sulfotelmatobacter sp.]|nr:hypothetical protein [Candidatus Sulfotelmatobacter sp.]